MDTEVAAATRRALRETRDELPALAERAQLMVPEAAADELAADDLEQFANAQEATLLEALDGRRRDAREFVLDTAVPALVGRGCSAPSIVQAQSAFNVLLSQRVAAAVPARVRDRVVAWLARFLGEYTRELAAHAIRAQR